MVQSGKLNVIPGGGRHCSWKAKTKDVSCSRWEARGKPGVVGDEEGREGKKGLSHGENGSLYVKS